MDGLAFTHDALTGFGIRHKIKIIASGKILTGYHIIRAMALGADTCNSARAMMLALGCIQALLCNTNRCPTGVATQDKHKMAGLVVEDKKQRVANYHRDTIESCVEMTAAMGLTGLHQVNRSHIYRRVLMNSVKSFEEIYPYTVSRALLNGNVPDYIKRDLDLAKTETWN